MSGEAAIVEAAARGVSLVAVGIHQLGKMAVNGAQYLQEQFKSDPNAAKGAFGAINSIIGADDKTPEEKLTAIHTLRDGTKDSGLRVFADAAMNVMKLDPLTTPEEQKKAALTSLTTNFGFLEKGKADNQTAIVEALYKTNKEFETNPQICDAVYSGFKDGDLKEAYEQFKKAAEQPAQVPPPTQSQQNDAPSLFSRLTSQFTSLVGGGPNVTPPPPPSTTQTQPILPPLDDGLTEEQKLKPSTNTQQPSPAPIEELTPEQKEIKENNQKAFDNFLGLITGPAGQAAVALTLALAVPPPLGLLMAIGFTAYCMQQAGAEKHPNPEVQNYADAWKEFVQEAQNEKAQQQQQAPKKKDLNDEQVGVQVDTRQTINDQDREKAKKDPTAIGSATNTVVNNAQQDLGDAEKKLKTDKESLRQASNELTPEQIAAEEVKKKSEVATAKTNVVDDEDLENETVVENWFDDAQKQEEIKTAAANVVQDLLKSSVIAASNKTVSNSSPNVPVVVASNDHEKDGGR